MPIRRVPSMVLRLATFAILLGASSPIAWAQLAPPRTLDELKQETQMRADKNLTPATGIKSGDAREALANLHSLAPDDWAQAWSAVAERYDKRAKSEEASGDKKSAQEDYRTAWRYYSFARWPVPNSPGKQVAYQNALTAFRNYARFMDPPLETVRIPFENKEIVGYLRLPGGVRPAPVLLAINGIDSRKEDEIVGESPLLRSGIGVFATDMPGTGEAPIKADVGSERLFSRVLDYLSSRPEIDGKRMATHGVSWGGHWAALLAYTERDRLRGSVVQGGPVHDYFMTDWATPSLNTREYLFGLFDARSAVYGVKTMEEFLAYAPRLSLKTAGYLGKPSAPMLIVNGAKDTQVPISDLYLLLQSGGSPKEAWVNPDGGHTGRSTEWPGRRISEEIVQPWIKSKLLPGSETAQAQRND